ncbi:MAG: glycosyltransferase [Chlamydiae bacterium]|nr:glycosyltransferase [Chlamydiota bacterium]MBI3277304.1 glycosyltransferase [Chlamydiota bacterium]
MNSTHSDDRNVTLKRRLINVFKHFYYSRKKRFFRFFNENFYLKRYPDVHAAVEKGRFSCGLEHYIRRGQGDGLLANFPYETLSSSFYQEISQVQDEWVFLKDFLASDHQMKILPAQHPQLSIILDVQANLEWILNIILLVMKENLPSFEMILIDRVGQGARSKDLLERIQALRICQVNRKENFVTACDRASGLAKGEYLLFLEPEILFAPKSITSALECITSSHDVGAVGGKVVSRNGVLEEAGQFFWKNGSLVRYGSFNSPLKPMYMFKREMDCCSSPFLLTKRDLFLHLGGLAKGFKTLQASLADYSIQLSKLRKKIIYNPDTVIISRRTSEGFLKRFFLKFSTRDRGVLCRRHQDWFETRYEYKEENKLLVRLPRSQIKILYLDDFVPHLFFGAGFPRTNQILSGMVHLGYFVTFYPMNSTDENWSSIYKDIPREVEVMADNQTMGFDQFWNERGSYYDLVFVSRPHSMKILKSILLKSAHGVKKPKIVYDAEALFCLREIGRKRVMGEGLSPEEMTGQIREEVQMTDGSDCVVSVSENESKLFLEHGVKKVHILSHSAPVIFSKNSFEMRSDILFVGRLDGLLSPNFDALSWFLDKIFPLFSSCLNEDAFFRVVGLNADSHKGLEKNNKIRVMGAVADLKSIYEGARIFVAPTRFGAGISLKAIEAAAFGVPVIATSLVANQLGWENGAEILIADDPKIFAEQCLKLYQDKALWKQIQQGAFERVKREYSENVFLSHLKEILDAALER